MHFTDHESAITDLSWSSGGFLLSSSLDKSVKIYHILHQTCLCTFNHGEIVSSVLFHPIDERYFVSGCLDGKIRTWSIDEKKVIFWNIIPKGDITAVSITNDGNSVIAGTSLGQCVFYHFQGMKYNTQVNISNDSSFSGKVCKITGMHPIIHTDGQELLLVTGSKSKLRLFNIKDKSVYRKYKGLDLKGGKSSASFSKDGRYIIAGSEGPHVLIWDTEPEITKDQQFSGVLSAVMQWQNDTSRTSGQERFVASNDAVTCAVFAPWKSDGDTSDPTLGFVIIASDLSGHIRIFENGSYRHSVLDKVSVSNTPV
jgi:WD40 repeat protein